MKKTQQNINLYDVESLANLLEDWLALMCQMQVINENFNHLPIEIAALRQLSLAELSQAEVKAKMEYLLANLEAQLPKLLNLEETINNSLARREIIEALQQKLKGNCHNNYEINFTRTILNRSHLKTTRNQDKFSKISSIGQTINRFWQQHYLKISIGFGIATIVSYGLFLVNFNQTTESDRNYTDSKIEEIQKIKQLFSL